MVYITRYFCGSRNLGKHLHLSFIDKLRIYVKGGDGGKGFPKLGGTGGDGGSVYIVGTSDLTLKDVYSKNLSKRYIAGNGEHSKYTKLYAEKGKDIEIQVPCGVTAIREDGNVYLGEINEPKERLLLVKGANGGCKRHDAEKGEKFMVYLDLKLIADVGLIGFPNAGKSTLLSLVSRASPKIANYPFTTLNPQLGTIEYEDGRIITMADMPGIIEGAHFNRGKGHKFLKHISRTKINVYIIDINGFQLNEKYDKHSAFETLVYLNKELEMYDASLIDKPSILLVNKIDTENAERQLDEFYARYKDFDKSLDAIEEYWRPTKRVNFDAIINTSIKKNINVDKLCVKIRDLIDRSTKVPKPTQDEVDEKN